MVLEVEEDSLVVGVRSSTNEKEITTLHNRSHFRMIIEEEETPQEMEEVDVEADELPIVAINEISRGIDHLSV